MKLSQAAPALLLALAACASSQHIRTAIYEETTTDYVAVISGPAGAQGVRVHCTDSDTYFEMNGLLIRFVGHRGYRGELGESRGHLRIGDVSFEYDGDRISYSGPLAHGSFERSGPHQTLEIDQTGAARVN